MWQDPLSNYFFGISKNPHIEFDVTLDAGGITANAMANPCPPAKPAESEA